MRNDARADTGLDDAAIVDAAVRRGIAFMTDGALIALIADRHTEEPAVVEAAIRELEDRNRKKPDTVFCQRGLSHDCGT
jgi:hypothetical protein